MNEPSANIMLFTTGFKEVTTILANAYWTFQSQLPKPSIVPVAITEALEKKLDQIEVNIQSIADKILHTLTHLSSLPLANNDALEKKVDQIKNEIESMVGKMLQALVG